MGQSAARELQAPRGRAVRQCWVLSSGLGRATVPGSASWSCPCCARRVDRSAADAVTLLLSCTSRAALICSEHSVTRSRAPPTPRRIFDRHFETKQSISPDVPPLTHGHRTRILRLYTDTQTLYYCSPLVSAHIKNARRTWPPHLRCELMRAHKISHFLLFRFLSAFFATLGPSLRISRTSS